MQYSLTQGPITKNILLFALPLMFGNLLIIFLGIAATFLYNYFANLLRAIGNSVVALAYLLSATPLGVTGIWLSVPIGWALADAIGIGYHLKKSACKNDEAMVR